MTWRAPILPWLSLIVVGATALAENPVPPLYLFHWGSASTLQRMATAAGPDATMFRFRRMSNAPSGPPIIAIAHGDLFGRPGLFTWSHPTSAMAMSVTGNPKNPGEVYARTSAEGPPSLIYMKIKPSARTLTVYSGSAVTPPSQHISFQNVDLILHQHLETENGVSFQEWVILNPAVVESFSASPKSLPKEILEEMIRSTTAGAVLHSNDIFILKNSSNPELADDVIRAQSLDFRASMLKEFLNTQEASIPELFKRPFLGADNVSPPRECSIVVAPR